ncbi:uncharacterized protein LOC130826547 [Amaranthus tricolor]|uniref:uncharacterized protein LOC130826547 n=1 Tax=Amaranthus tricolor TaxID=29722 RepID=UPI00258D23CE|nr:uncharacterized protein LOC130826547 [Amaranthus tricolor]
MPGTTVVLTNDPPSVYIIHPSENPTYSLVTEKFNGECYNEWKRSMTIALSAKKKLCFVDGSLSRPNSGPEMQAWDRCNAMITSYILHSVDNTIARSVLYFTSAREIWKDLEDRYSQSSGPQLYNLQQSLNDLSQGSTPIAKFFTKIKAVWDEITGVNPVPICTYIGCTGGITQKILKQQQEERLIQLLMKLDGKYASVRTNILMMQPLPNVSLAYRFLMQEEKQRQVSMVDIGNVNSMAFYSN